jgi:hypothetical protein
MREVAGVVVCAAFSVLWSAFVVANLLQIRAQRQRKKQAIKYYLSRMSAVFAVGMFIDNVATSLAYQLQGEAFTAMMAFGTLMRTLLTQLMLVMLSIATYQTLLAAHNLKVTVISRGASSLRRRFVGINVGSCVWSTVVTVICVSLNKGWLGGLVKIMWAVVITLLLVCFWYYFLLIMQTARTNAMALGVTWAQNSLRKPVFVTIFTSFIAFYLLGMGTLELLDRQETHHPESLEAHTHTHAHIHTHAHTHTHTHRLTSRPMS